MDMMTAQPTKKSGFLIRFLLFIVGVDEETLLVCPQRDWENVRAVGLLLVCTWLYQTALFSIISNRLFAAPGEILPSLLAASAFLASFIMSIDSYMILRSGWNLQGLQELKRGGIDISGGAMASIKAGFFLAIRIILSIGIAQLTAIFLSLLIFGSDITARLQESYQKANAALIASSTTLVDEDIRRATNALNTETAQDAALAAQVTVLRQNEIDPSAGDPEVQLAEQQVAQLLAQKSAADQAVVHTEMFASDEIGGIIGAPGNSGVPGSGPRRHAALEAVSNAKDQDQQLIAELDTAQSRLGTLRSHSLTGSAATEQQSKTELPTFEPVLTAEETKLASMKNALAAQEANRDSAISAAVKAAPNYVPYDNGLLTQLTVLDQISHENRKITAVIILVDVTSFGFELAAVLAKVTSYVPTTYAALLARAAYMDVVRLVDEMMEELNAPTNKKNPEFRFVPSGSSEDEARQGRSQRGAAHESTGDDPFSGIDWPAAAKPKRGRGRPRKGPPVPYKG